MSIREGMGRDKGSRAGLRPVLLGLLLAALLGCDDTGGGVANHGLRQDSPAADDLSGDWTRVGYPDCEGTLPLQELPVQQYFIYNNQLSVEQYLEDLTFSIDGRQAMGGRLLGANILLDVSYRIAIDAVPPLRYAEISVHRSGHVLDDGSRLEFRDRYESYGDYLTCRHEFERT